MPLLFLAATVARVLTYLHRMLLGVLMLAGVIACPDAHALHPETHARDFLAFTTDARPACDAGSQIASGQNDLFAYDIASGATLASESALNPVAGQKLYRVYGGDSLAGGASWSPINPGSVADFRNVAGLPSGGVSGANNTGRFIIEGTLMDTSAVLKTRSALPLDGKVGGLPEFIIPKWQESGAIRVDRVMGVNPEF